MNDGLNPGDDEMGSGSPLGTGIKDCGLRPRSSSLLFSSLSHTHSTLLLLLLFLHHSTPSCLIPNLIPEDFKDRGFKTHRKLGALLCCVPEYHQPRATVLHNRHKFQYPFCSTLLPLFLSFNMKFKRQKGKPKDEFAGLDGFPLSQERWPY